MFWHFWNNFWHSITIFKSITWIHNSFAITICNCKFSLLGSNLSCPEREKLLFVNSSLALYWYWQGFAYSLQNICLLFFLSPLISGPICYSDAIHLFFFFFTNVSDREFWIPLYYHSSLFYKKDISSKKVFQHAYALNF